MSETNNTLCAQSNADAARDLGHLLWEFGEARKQADKIGELMERLQPALQKRPFEVIELHVGGTPRRFVIVDGGLVETRLIYPDDLDEPRQARTRPRGAPGSCGENDLNGKARPREFQPPESLRQLVERTVREILDQQREAA